MTNKDINKKLGDKPNFGSHGALMSDPYQSDLDRVVLDPTDAFERRLIEMVEIHRKKARDYAGDGHPNANFYGSGKHVGLTAGHACEVLIGTKEERLSVMLPQFWNSTSYAPANESIYDTLLDRAVYSVIALTIWDEDGYVQQTPRTEGQKHNAKMKAGS